MKEVCVMWDGFRYIYINIIVFLFYCRIGIDLIVLYVLLFLNFRSFDEVENFIILI